MSKNILPQLHHLRDHSPCDHCRFAERCRPNLLACEAFGMYLHGLSETRWRIAPRVPTRERYQALRLDEAG